MNRRILVLTTHRASREDGNVYYAFYKIVEHPTKTFDEPIFANDCSKLKSEKLLEEIEALGYIVSDPGTIIISHE